MGYAIKTSYVLNLIDVLPNTIDIPSSHELQDLPLTEQVKALTNYVVLVKVKYNAFFVLLNFGWKVQKKSNYKNTSYS